MSKRNLIYFAGGAVALLLLIAFFAFTGGEDEAQKEFRRLKDKPVVVREIDESVLAGIQLEDMGEGAMGRTGDLSFEQIVALLRQKYGDRLDNAAVQIEMLEELIRYYQKMYPDSWVAMLQEVLYAAFPDRAAELFRLSENMYEYQKQVQEEKDQLAQMEPEERQEYLWNLRNRYFGDKAGEIWAGARKQQTVSESLDQIASNKDLSVTEKVNAYRASIEEAYGDASEVMLERRRTEFTHRFFDAVQEDLAEMDHSDRRLAYRQIWEEMGHSADAVERLDGLEDERDQRWSNGEVYEARRKELQSSYSGDELEQELDQLREELFGDEASVIKSEEQSGFYRFQRDRRYGRE